MEQAGSRHSRLPIPISTLGGWHREAHHAVHSIASNIASRAIMQFWHGPKYSVSAPCSFSRLEQWLVSPFGLRWQCLETELYGTRCFYRFVLHYWDEHLCVT